MKTVLSGIQPTGGVHLGNYLGAIRNWIDLQNQHNCFFGIMNLHAITVPQNPIELRKNILDVAAIYLACGLDPKKSSIFVQGEVSEHLELAWVLGSLTPLGWLNRMTQFKDKIKTNLSIEHINDLVLSHDKIVENFDYNKFVESKLSESSRQNLIDNPEAACEAIRVLQEIILWERHEKDLIGKSHLGLYSYPVLMASDILLYRADLVPVGEDQKQHLELTRDLAGAFNRRYNNEYFKLPEPLIIKGVKRIMSLQDGTKKMSKSDESDLSRINLEDSSELIVKKIKKSKTDSFGEISYDENRPEIFNLLNIFASFDSKAPEAIAEEYKTSGYGKFKGDLAEIIVEKLRPIQDNLARFKQDQGFLVDVLNQGKENASKIAKKTRAEVFKIVGLN